jgi:hypothetical protein
MDADGNRWFEGLQAFAAAEHGAHPVPCRDTLPLKARWERRIVGAGFCHWLKHDAPGYQRERACFAGLKGWERDPYVVFTSSDAGLAAAREILGDTPDRVACLRPRELERWLAQAPDPEYRWHIHTWSYFARPDREMMRIASRYPLAGGESFWMHREGTFCGRLMGQGADHLWKWDGKEPVLLDGATRERVS